MRRATIVIVALLCTSACSDADSEMETDVAAGNGAAIPDAAAQSAAPRIVENVGLQSPETVLWDSIMDVYLVSNINGKPGDEDNNGFIARIRPDGTVEQLKWIEGGRGGVTLHGPKGMLFHADTLFVADVAAVRLFHRSTGQPLGERAVATKGLNDLALDNDGWIYATDLEPPGGNAATAPPAAIYRVTARGGVPVVRGGELQQPDGLLADGAQFVVAPFGGNELFRIDSAGARQVIATLPGGKLDGLYPLPGGGWAVTSWDRKAVYAVDRAGTVRVLVGNIDSPAQLGFDRTRNVLLIPSFNGNAVHIEPLRGTRE